MTRRIKHQDSCMQRLPWLVKRLVGAHHHLRVAIYVDFGLRALDQNPTVGGDLNLSFAIFDILRNLKVEGRKSTAVSARGLFQHDIVSIVAIEFDFGADVYSADGFQSQRMHSPYPQPIGRAFLSLSGSCDADREDVGSDF